MLVVSKNRANNNSRGHDEYSRVRYRNWLSAIDLDSAAWLSAGMSPKSFVISNDEFTSAICRRNTFEDRTILKYTPFLATEDFSLFKCVCVMEVLIRSQLIPLDIIW